MANTNGFNDKLDKITEREVVFDFLSRLSFGNNAVDSYTKNTIFYKDSNFKDAFIRLAMALPHYALDQIFCSATKTVKISAGTQTLSTTTDREIVAIKGAILEPAGVDIKDMLNVGSDWKTVTATFDVPFKKDSLLKIYYYHPFVM